MKKNKKQAEVKKVLRCAIYTRKSKNEGLDDEFTTLDAQRESCEHYIRAMKTDGWEIVPTRYDDGGFTGANIERPAMGRLIADLEEGKVDCVVVYKVDRLSRSLLDFARLAKLFDERGVSFVSTTQQFDTTKSIGRLVLNILMTFAQFEREMISERTRDKLAAARKRGKWTGSTPVYGYSVVDKKLVPEPVEAERVREMFEMYLRLGGVKRLTEEVASLGWKRRVRQKFARDTWFTSAVHRLLRNRIYTGKLEYQGEVFEGEHDAIVSDELFDAVQESLDERRAEPPQAIHNAVYMLTGVLRCGRCDSVMTSSSGKSRGGKRYRYYNCVGRQRRGKDKCDHPLVRADEIEKVVAEQLWKHCTAPGMIEELTERVEVGQAEIMAELKKRRDTARKDAARCRKEGERLFAAFRDGKTPGPLATDRLVKIDGETAEHEARAQAYEAEMGAVASKAAELGRMGAIFAAFSEAWPQLSAQERRELVGVVVETVEVDDAKGRLNIVFQDLGGPLTGAGLDTGPEPAREGAAA